MKNLLETIRKKAHDAGTHVRNLLHDRKGDIAVSTIGGIIITVVVIGLLVLAINAFFPGFFTGIFTSMSQKLNANW